VGVASEPTRLLSGYEEVVEVWQHLSREGDRGLNYRFRNTHLLPDEAAGHPLTVYVDTLLQDVMFRERQRQPLTNHLQYMLVSALLK